MSGVAPTSAGRMVVALSDDVARLETLLADVKALAQSWVDADGEPATNDDLIVLTVTNRRGRELLALLDKTSDADLRVAVPAASWDRFVAEHDRLSIPHTCADVEYEPNNCRLIAAVRGQQ